MNNLLNYNSWANRRIMAEVEKLPVELFEKRIGGSFGSLKATLVHLLESDWLWLQRFNGIPLADLPEWRIDNATTLHEIWKPIQDESSKVVDQYLNEPGKVITFITRKGSKHTLPFEEIVTHISHHGSYHRGQLTHIIRELGGTPVGTDYFIYCVSK